MGSRLRRLIASYPRQPAALAGVVNRALRDFPGIAHDWEVIEFLTSHGFSETTYASQLPAFHRLIVKDGDVYGAISRLYRHIYFLDQFRLAAAAPDAIGFNLLIEPDRTLRIASGPGIGIGSQFDLSKGDHAAYLEALGITDATGGRIAKDAAGNDVEGDGVTVAVVDSGAEAGALANGVADFRDIVSPPPYTPTDNLGHGTAMMRIIQAVAPKARVCAVRIFDMYGPELSDAYAGIVGALNDFKPDVVSLSLGFPDLASPCTVCGSHASSRSTMFGHLFGSTEKLAAAGVSPDPIFVAATGNDHPTMGMYYPAAYANESILAVGSIRKSKRRSAFSNFGKAGGGEFAVAPGGDWDYQANVVAEYVGEGQDAQGNRTYCLGTSPATAYAAGLMALYREQVPRSPGSALEVVDKAISQCSKDLLPTHAPNEHGSGRLVFASLAGSPSGSEDDSDTGVHDAGDTVRISSRTGSVWVPKRARPS